jgi:hypothetical protein
MKYEGQEEEKKVYASELFALVIFALCLAALMLPASLDYLRSIA